MQLKNPKRYKELSENKVLCPLIVKYLLLALAGPCHLREQALERGVLVQLVLLHQPAQVARRRRQLDLAEKKMKKMTKKMMKMQKKKINWLFLIWKIDIRKTFINSSNMETSPLLFT